MPLERDRLLHRMAVNLEVEALAGRAGRKENQTAARLWLGMRENVAPFPTIPFVRELASSAVDAITEDLRHGFKNQRDAFAGEGMASSDPESALSDMLQQLLGDAEFSDAPPSELMEMLSGRKSRPRGKAKPKKNATKDRNIYRLAVEIIGCPPMSDDFMRANPGIVREIEIAGDQTLDKLHHAIFKAFDREEMHAYEFQLSDKQFDRAAPRYVHPQLMNDDSGDGPVHNAATTTLDELGLTVGQAFLYWFDFGDDWWHGITVKEIGPPEPRRRYPRVAARHGSSPPQYPEE